jgi:hypothetical protein
MKIPMKTLRSLCFFFMITYSSLSYAGLDLCSQANTYIMPSIGYLNHNQQSMFGTNFSWRDGPELCLWKGAYVEYFTGLKDQHMFGTGVFIGTILLGLDFAALYYKDIEESEIRYRIRPVFSMIYFDVYYGVVINPNATNTDYFSEFGFLIKFPISKKSYDRY